MDKFTIRSLRTKAEYLRDSEAWVRKQRRQEKLRLLLIIAALASLVAVVLGWPCADAVCAPAG